MTRIILGYIPVREYDGKCGAIPWLDTYEQALKLATRLSMKDGEPRTVKSVHIHVDESALENFFTLGEAL